MYSYIFRSEVSSKYSICLLFFSKRSGHHFQRLKHSSSDEPRCRKQCFCFSRNIGQIIPKFMYFHYLLKHFLDQSIQKMLYSILKIEVLDGKYWKSTRILTNTCIRVFYDCQQLCGSSSSAKNEAYHCFLFSRYISLVSAKIIYFH